MNFNIDLKSIDLKNISLEDIQAKLKNVEKKTWIKIGSVVGAVVLFLIIFIFVETFDPPIIQVIGLFIL